MFEPPRPRQATLIPREQLHNPRRLPSQSLARPIEPQAQPVGNSEADAPLSTAECQAALNHERERARAAGHAEGLQAGREQGREEGYQQGREVGYADGHASGLEAGDAQVRSTLASLEQVVEQCSAAVSSMHSAATPALLNLALAVARQVIRAEITSRPQLIADVVRQVLEAETAAPCSATVHLHPDDAAQVQQHVGESLAEHQWRIATDDTLERGGCVVRSVYGDLDASLQTRWRRVCEAAGGKLPWES